MKTKHILTAIALPALLAACSQDEDLSSALSQKDFSNIPTVDVNFTASVNEDDPSTRMATQFGWELGDKIGLAWLGDGTTITPDGKAYQNHPMFCTDAAKAFFETKTMLYVGKYYAYMPYNAEIKDIEEIGFNVTDQVLDATTATYAKKAIYISPKLTELKAVPAEGEEGAGMGKNINLPIRQLSNAPTINLTFGNASKFADLKVMGISLDVKNAGTSILPASFTYAPTQDASVADWKEMTSATTISEFYAASTVTAGPIVAKSEEGLAVVDNKLKTYILTLPVSVTQSSSTLDIIVTTNYGDVKVDLTSEDAGGNANKAIELKDRDDATVKTLANSKIFNNFGSAGDINVYVDMTNAELGSPISCKNAIEIENAINLWSKVESSTDLKIQIVKTADADDKIILTDLNSSLPSSITGALTLDATAVPVEFAGTTQLGKVTLAGDKEYTFAGNTTITGEVSITSTSVAGVAIANDATVTIDGGAVTYNVANATFDLNAATSNPAKAGAILNLINAGEFNKTTDANNATVKVGKGATINVGNLESSGYIRSKSASSDNNSGTINFYNGTQNDFDNDGTGKIAAIVSNAIAFEAAVTNNVIDITVKGGTINFGAFTLSEKTLNITIDKDGAFNLGKKQIEFATLTVAADAAIFGTAGCKLTTSGVLSILPNTTLTVNENVEVNATSLSLPSLATLSNAGTFKYITATLVGGTVIGETTKVESF